MCLVLGDFDVDSTTSDVPVVAENPPVPTAPAGVLRGDRGTDLAQGLIAAFLAATITFLTYFVAVQAPLHGPDQVLLADHPQILQLARVAEVPGAMPYGPLTSFGIALNAALLGTGAAGLHLVNVLLLALNAALLLLLLHKAFPKIPVAAMLGGVLLATLHPMQAPAATLIVARPLLQGTAFGLAALLCLWPPRVGVPLSGRRVAMGLVLYAMAAASAIYWVLLPIVYIMARWVDGSDVRLQTEKKLYGILLGAMGFGLITLQATGRMLQMARPPMGMRVLAQGVGDLFVSFVTFGGTWPGDTIATSPSLLHLVFGITIIVTGLIAVSRRMVWAIPMRWFALLGGAVALFMPGAAGSGAAVVPAVAVLGALLLSEIPAGPLRKGIGLLVSAAAVAGGALAYLHITAWTDPVAYWTHAAEAGKDPLLLKPLARYAAAEAARAGNPQDRAAWLDREGQAWRAVQAVAPEDPAMLAGLGIVMADLGHTEEAVPLLTAAIEAEPARFDTTLALANALEKWVQVDGAQFSAPQTTRTDEDVARERRAVAYYERAATLAPLPPQAQLQYGLTLALLGNREAGLPLLKQANAAAPSDALAKLVQDMEKGVQDTAALDQQVRQALVKNGPDPDTLTKQAEAYLRKGQVIPARYLLQKLAREPKNLNAWVQLGLLSLRTGAVEPFIEEYGKVQVGNNAVWMDLAARTCQAGQWDAARQLLEFNATQSTTATSPLLDLADIALALKDPNRAAKLLQELTQLQPADPNPWLKLADIALATGQSQQAGRFLDEAAQRGATPEALSERRSAAGGGTQDGGRQIERTVIQ